MSALILLADADPFNLRLLSELCSSLGYEIVTAADGGAVLDAVARVQPDLVLMDVSLPVMDGMQVLRILKADHDLSHVPIVLVTSDGDDDARRRGVELGADDYVTKPYRSFEIQQRLRNVLRLRAAVSSGQSGNDQPSGRLDTADPVTGTGTSSQLHISLDYEFTRAVRYKHPLGCVVVRCVNYPQVTASLGAVTAQQVLAQLAMALRGCIRGVDHLFRSGSDEFTILLPETDARGCRIVVGRVQTTTSRDQLFDAEVRPRPSIAVAFACYPTSKVADGEALWRGAADELRH
jgi:two-component system, cell cycle response regulator